MMHPLIRRIFVLLIAVLVTAGMGLPAVQAHSMPMMDMGKAMVDGMSMPMPAKCPDCSKSGQDKGMPGCVSPVCTAQSAVPPNEEALRLTQFRPLHLRPLRSHLLVGHDSVPDPYPPRASDIV